MASSEGKGARFTSERISVRISIIAPSVLGIAKWGSFPRPLPPNDYVVHYSLAAGVPAARAPSCLTSA